MVAFVALCEGFLGISPHFDVEVLLCCHPPEEEGEERQVGATHANGVHWHPALEQSGR